MSSGDQMSPDYDVLAELRAEVERLTQRITVLNVELKAERDKKAEWASTAYDFKAELEAAEEKLLKLEALLDTARCLACGHSTLKPAKTRFEARVMIPRYGPRKDKPMLFITPAGIDVRQCAECPEQFYTGEACQQVDALSPKLDPVEALEAAKWLAALSEGGSLRTVDAAHALLKFMKAITGQA